MTDAVRPADRALASGKLPGSLLEHLIETYRTRPDPTVVVSAGYGRDAAAVTVDPDSLLIIKSDPITFTTDNAAHYLIAVNANDISCLGGVPKWISVVLLLPEHVTTEPAVEAHFADLQSAADRLGVSIVGGHTEITSAVTRPVFIGTMLGVAGPAGLLRPGLARPGDILYLTHSAGIEGTAILARELASPLSAALGPAVVERAAALLDSPGIGISTTATLLLETGAITGLHDPTEGGVATAIHELAAASSAGAEIDRDRIPTLPETASICAHFGIDPLGLISSGALLVAARPDGTASLDRAARSHHIPLTRIGVLAPHTSGIHFSSGEPVPRFDSDEITKVL